MSVDSAFDPVSFRLFQYRGTIVNIVDGDTMDVRIDLGFRVYHQVRIRLNGVDAPEIFTGTEEERRPGKMVKIALENYIAVMCGRVEKAECLVRTQKVTARDGTEYARKSLDRYVADVWIRDRFGDYHGLVDVVREIMKALEAGKEATWPR